MPLFPEESLCDYVSPEGYKCNLDKGHSGIHQYGEYIDSTKSEDDPVNHPSHYTFSKIEVIDAIEAWGCGFHDGNVIKYVARYRYKNNPVEDLKKARWYLDRLIKQSETV
jgi:hypothetical protein